MVKKDLIIFADYREHSLLSYHEICETYHISPEFVVELVKHDIITPQGKKPEEWLFDADQLPLLRKALRLKRDLELDVTSLSIVLDLLAQLELLKKRMELLEKHYLNRGPSES